VIQRGPHGDLLAPPVSRGEGGIRWWSESLYRPDAWRPQQKVIGITGLGAGEDPDTNTIVQFKGARDASRSYLEKGDRRGAELFLGQARSFYARLSSANQRAYADELVFLEKLVAGDAAARGDSLSRTQRKAVDEALARERARPAPGVLENLPGAIKDTLNDAVNAAKDALKKPVVIGVLALAGVAVAKKYWWDK
jgi:hypothetical protein